MNQKPPVNPVNIPATWPMYRSMVGVGLLCGLLIVIVFHYTKPVIQRNLIAARQQAIFKVLPGARTSTAFRFIEGEGFELTSPDSIDSNLIFAGYDDQHALVGVAIEAQGMGYQDVIRLLYGYSFTTETILGIRVLESRETPGLGDRIEIDSDFLRNFDSLDVSLAPSGTELAHPIEFVKPGQKKSPWQIDGITGATISSRAVARMLHASSSWWIPLVHPQKTNFRYQMSEN